MNNNNNKDKRGKEKVKKKKNRGMKSGGREDRRKIWDVFLSLLGLGSVFKRRCLLVGKSPLMAFNVCEYAFTYFSIPLFSLLFWPA